MHDRAQLPTFTTARDVDGLTRTEAQLLGAYRYITALDGCAAVPDRVAARMANVLLEHVPAARQTLIDRGVIDARPPTADELLLFGVHDRPEMMVWIRDDGAHYEKSSV
jgi:hypothetical protein